MLLNSRPQRPFCLPRAPFLLGCLLGGVLSVRRCCGRWARVFSVGLFFLRKGSQPVSHPAISDLAAGYRPKPRDAPSRRTNRSEPARADHRHWQARERDQSTHPWLPSGHADCSAPCAARSPGASSQRAARLQNLNDTATHVGRRRVPCPACQSEDEFDAAKLLFCKPEMVPIHHVTVSEVVNRHFSGSGP